MKIFLIVILVVGAVAGTVAGVVWSQIHSSETAVSNSPVVSLEANNSQNSVTVSSETPVSLTWNFSNVSNCQILSNLSETLPIFASSSPGLVLVGKIAESRTYTLTCFDGQNKAISDSVAINVSATAAVPASVAASSAYDLFKNFQYNWTKNLSLGLKNDQDVAALQTVLFIEGFLPSQDSITSNFDQATFDAVKKFQAAYEIDPTGYVGPVTVAKLNILYGTGTTPKTQPSTISSASGSNSPIITGSNFNAYDNVVALSDFNLRDDDCNVIGTVKKGTLMQIISSTKKVCTINGQNYEMRQVTIYATSQTGWAAEIYLGLASSSATASAQNPTSAVNSIIASGITVSLKANGSSIITVPGNSSVVLSWTSSNANSCTASGYWSGNKATTGSELISNVSNNSYYTLTCSNSTASFSSSAAVNISTSGSASTGSLTSPSTGGLTAFPTSSDASSTPTADTFGGLVSNVDACTIPPSNFSIQILSPSGNGGHFMQRYIWQYGKSKILYASSSWIYGLPVEGEWLLGELGDSAQCWGSGGPGRLIKSAGFGYQ